jgi:hypothetical protein
MRLLPPQLEAEPVVAGVVIDPAIAGLFVELAGEVERQDGKHGPFEGTRLGASRLALACIEDELDEAYDAWRDERQAVVWDHTRTEVLQIAAVAIRALRDAL